MQVYIITLFPELFNQFISTSIIGIALKKELINFRILNLRDFTEDKRKTVDSPPYGGGPGMIMKAIPLINAIRFIQKEIASSDVKLKVILTSPKGKLLTQHKCSELAKEEILVIVCGHYSGVDQRFIDQECDEEISIGNYVLTGGEIPSMVIIDSVCRLLPGVLGNAESHLLDSFSEKNNGRLQPPVYTRPMYVSGKKVPDVLLSGNHNEIKKWRNNKSNEITQVLRPGFFCSKSEN